MNFIQMMNSTDSFRYLTAFKIILPLLFLLIIPVEAVSQIDFLENDLSLLQYRHLNAGMNSFSGSEALLQESQTKEEFPEPGSVLLKSVMIPGWGQIVNGQAWKVPIVYGLLTGSVLYTRYLTKQYHDYRAAFFNSSRGEDSDFRFGETPPRLVGLNSEQLRSQRNSFRNQRDFAYVIIGLAYGLNVLDAYVFAHMKSFDVSDDLSASASVRPDLIDGRSAGMTISFALVSKNK